MAVGRLDLHSHPAQRLGDALVGPHRQRLVADELEAAVLTGEQAAGEPQDGACVAAVDRRPRRTQAAQADALHANVVVAVVGHLDAAGAHDVDRRERVGGSPEAANAALPVCDRGEQYRPL